MKESKMIFPIVCNGRAGKSASVISASEHSLDTGAAELIKF